MQIAVSGMYKNGKIVLDELPPLSDETAEVMVVFLPKKSALASNRITDKASSSKVDSLFSMQELGGILEAYVDAPLTDEVIEKAIVNGALKRAMLSNNNE